MQKQEGQEEIEVQKEVMRKETEQMLSQGFEKSRR